MCWFDGDGRYIAWGTRGRTQYIHTHTANIANQFIPTKWWMGLCGHKNGERREEERTNVPCKTCILLDHFNEHTNNSNGAQIQDRADLMVLVALVARCCCCCWRAIHIEYLQTNMLCCWKLIIIFIFSVIIIATGRMYADTQLHDIFAWQ